MKDKWLLVAFYILFLVPFFFSPIYKSNATGDKESQECDININISTVPGDINYSQLYLPNPLQFDPSNPTTITCGTPITISVLDGCPPFNWNVSGTGYTLTDLGDNERSKILNCSGST